MAEQFAIAEAKLRAWTSVDEEDMDESCEGDSTVNDEQMTTTQSSGGVTYNYYGILDFSLIQHSLHYMHYVHYMHILFF